MIKEITPCLSIDGGGMRGLFSAYFMKYFCEDAKIDGNKLYNYFPIISGTSIGGISALAYSMGKSPDDMIDFFINKGPLIFYPPVSTVQKIKTILYGDVTFYSNEELRRQIEGVFGDAKMYQLKTTTLVTSVEVFYTTVPDVGKDVTNARPVFFSNVKMPGFEGQTYKISDVALATSAAPLYFPPIKITDVSILDSVFIDGGTYLNNTTAGNWAIANALHPISNKVCLLSVGTGLGSIGLFDPQPVPPEKLGKEILELEEYEQFLLKKGYSQEEINKKVKDIIPDFGNVYLLLDILSLGITGPQEAINKQVEMQSFFGTKLSNKDLHYYRFQKVLDPKINTELDSTTPEFLQYMQTAAQKQYSDDKLKIRAFIEQCNF